MEIPNDLRNHIYKIKEEYEARIGCILPNFKIEYSKNNNASVSCDQEYILKMSNIGDQLPTQEVNCILYHEFTHLYDLEIVKRINGNLAITSAISEIHAAYIEMKYRLGFYEGELPCILDLSFMIKYRDSLISISDFLNISVQNVFDGFNQGDIAGAGKQMQYLFGQLKCLEELRRLWFNPKYYIQLLTAICGDKLYDLYSEAQLPFEITIHTIESCANLGYEIIEFMVLAYQNTYHKLPNSLLE